ncbi:MAG: LON peptidase substrate-binding domain-containing protein [Bdellovibrionota bacterium]|nr:LON peptidase substrate-binding domain-containing protein [Bdellovibrionota bacterium]
MKANLFPLSKLILSPGGKLTLNIFEPRYLALLEDCLKNDIPMALGHACSTPLEGGVSIPHETYCEVFCEVGFGTPQVLTTTPQGSQVVVVNGEGKGKLCDLTEDERGFLKAELKEVSYQDQLESEQTFLYRRLKSITKEQVSELLKNDREAEILMSNLNTPNELVAFYSDHLMKSFDHKLSVFKQNDINEKIQLIGQYLVA